MPFGLRVVRVVVVVAPLAGATVAYAVEGGSLGAALVLGGLMSGGIWLLAWWLLGKTGLRARDRAR